MTANVIEIRRATTATAPATIATIPAVLVRSCTWVRIGRSAAGGRTRPADPRDVAHRDYWNVTGSVSELFEVLCSPGTGTTSAVTV